jgi:RimJ/RimL family protein N-acetyltransferase
VAFEKDRRVPGERAMKVYLTTERLILREFNEGDLDRLVELNGDPEVMRFVTGGAPLSPDHIRGEVLPAFLRLHAESPAFGYWAAVERATGEFLGWFQFRPKAVPAEGVELGFRLRRAAWGKGYATEGSRALGEKGFRELGVERVFARAMAANAASIRVIEKCGLTFVRDYAEPGFPEGEQAAVLYARTKPARYGPPPRVRPCRPEDFDAVLALLRQLWPDRPLDAEAIRAVYDRALGSDAQAYLCATDGERVIGFGSLTIKNNLWQAGPLGHLDELVVDGGWRGRGVGARLLEELIDLARRRGCRRVELDSALHRVDAHRFYERHGFENRAYLFSKPL